MIVRLFRRLTLARALGLGAGVMALAATALVAAVIAFGMFEVRPARAVIGPPPPDLHAENVVIASASGASLHGWLVPGRSGGGVVILMHGVRSNRLSMLARARLLKEAGFSVLLFDFQAHGDSTGTHITFGQLEGMDAAAAVALLRQRLPNERVGAIGTSLGGAAALLAPAPLPVDALVLESVFPDIGSAVADRIRSTLGALLGPWLTPPLAALFDRLLPPILDIDPAQLRPIDHVAQVAAPVFVASGERDEHTTIDEARALFDRARAPKIFWAVPGAGHTDLEAFAPAEYRRRILPFLTAALQR